MTGIPKYCSIPELNLLLPERNLVNCVIDRAGASIADYDVVRNIENFIDKASTDLDGELRRYTDIPIDPTVTTLTGSFQFVRGSTVVNVVGGLALTELARGDELRPDDQEDIRLIIDSVENDTTIHLVNVFYYEIDLTSAASKYVRNVPSEVIQLCSDHCAWLIWARRTEEENNPQARKEIDYRRTIEDIRAGKFRFERVGGGIVKKIPTLTDLTVEKTFTDESMQDYNLT